ncbi:hypothetical protein VTJ04DRAFT_4657 [Mycothermus thermophilus]|uniref:uncharacterized protein n=1 Tax=Humicola insolens TaxID=85995 RepID=UPI003742161B
MVLRERYPVRTGVQPPTVSPTLVMTESATPSSDPAVPAGTDDAVGGPTPSPCSAPAAGAPNHRDGGHDNDVDEEARTSSSSESDSESDSEPKPPKPIIPHPKLLLKIQDLSHPGTAKFLSAVPDPGAVLSEAVDRIGSLLYSDRLHAPRTRSVTLVLRDMDGIAYTTGSDLDDDHKEIHFSLRYIDHIHPQSRLADEIRGVLTHELVHCYQWDARGTCPGGLIEGVADWVRLCCDLGPPHWRRGTEGSWDSGSDHTAYFLEYLETRFGPGTVRAINARLQRHRYRGEDFWRKLLGKTVEELWSDYVDAVKNGEGKGMRIVRKRRTDEPWGENSPC